ncbi:hypothetical protein FEM13_24265 [Pseudomonas aeruginosa]|nr:hypothetical protein FEM32_21705 [Pseudomonas aeruginosa]TLJ24280.1 hypothetical protein FEM31_04795 [Pseudomonas aeruginosa]TLJ30687.1 hypothetical protein FEM25_16535 [Pseudomonas aeruginosa]TLJ38623.1 hypothetical protein FEM20_15850 [Pseudomonas aeruginosa]TLJ52769.1 hypothetical protein FEM16_07200 [Pseudomonas aeruginosa]
MGNFVTYVICLPETQEARSAIVSGVLELVRRSPCLVMDWTLRPLFWRGLSASKWHNDLLFRSASRRFWLDGTSTELLKT